MLFKLRLGVGLILILAIAACAAEPNDFPSPPPEVLTSFAATRAAAPTATATMTLPPSGGALPDLTLSIVTSVAPPVCYDGHSRIGALVVVANSGADSGPFMVEVNGVWQAVPEGLKRGERRTLWFDGQSFARPWEQFVGRVDPADQVAESDETNNTSTIYVATLTPPPPCPTGTPSPL